MQDSLFDFIWTDLLSHFFHSKHSIFRCWFQLCFLRCCRRRDTIDTMVQPDLCDATKGRPGTFKNLSYKPIFKVCLKFSTGIGQGKGESIQKIIERLRGPGPKRVYAHIAVSLPLQVYIQKPAFYANSTYPACGRGRRCSTE